MTNKNALVLTLLFYMDECLIILQQETSSEVVKMEEEENVFEKCSLNLLEHISHLHDSIEERLDLIEQQVTGGA